jgi:hypothetical protein
MEGEIDSRHPKTMKKKHKYHFGKNQCRNVLVVDYELPFVFSCVNERGHKGMHENRANKVEKGTGRIIYRGKKFYWK